MDAILLPSKLVNKQCMMKILLNFSALQRERQLNAQLREVLDEERSSLHDTSSREKAAITDLQAMLDLERSKLLELHTTVEKEKNKVQSLNSFLSTEQSRAMEELEQERATCRQLKNSLETLQVSIQYTSDADYTSDINCYKSNGSSSIVPYVDITNCVTLSDSVFFIIDTIKIR